MVTLLLRSMALLATPKKMPIEQYLLKMDPYRCSTANPVFPVPLRLETIDESLRQELCAISDGEIRKCLTNHGIKDTTHFDYYHVYKPFYPNGGDIKVLTLVIHADVGDEESTAGWLPASQSPQFAFQPWVPRGLCGNPRSQTVLSAIAISTLARR